MKKKIRKRKTKTKNSAKTDLKRQMKRNPLTRNMQVVDAPAGTAKMSDMLDELVEPFADEADTEGAYTNLITIGVIAWNTAVLPRDQLDESLAILKSNFPDKEDFDTAQGLLFELMKRKLELFPDEQRLVVDFSLTQENDSWHLQVASTLPPEGLGTGD